VWRSGCACEGGHQALACEQLRLWKRMRSDLLGWVHGAGNRNRLRSYACLPARPALDLTQAQAELLGQQMDQQARHLPILGRRCPRMGRC